MELIVLREATVLQNSQRGITQHPLTFLHGQVKSESEIFAVGCGVEYLSGKLLPWTVESWEFVWHVSQFGAVA
jgi:hypothetical protein